MSVNEFKFFPLQTLLDTSWGSPKDLGILLANFLLTIGIRCWVVLGIAYPHGESAYVLYQDEGDFVMLDPSTGKKYATKDAYCPMNKVFYIFSQDNVREIEQILVTHYNFVLALDLLQHSE